MKNIFAFRVDASIQIGSGHVMRCLTLADALKDRGSDCRFICREHSGNLIELIRNKGYLVHALTSVTSESENLLAKPASSAMVEGADAKCEVNSKALAHASWLGSSQEDDARECSAILNAWQPDWLIVDHYSLDVVWEEIAKPECAKLFVIDDLADRAHIADLLLDQNLGRELINYKDLVPDSCQILMGPHYALLRPEFLEFREYSLKRREKIEVKNILVSMGGVDAENATGKVLDALAKCSLPKGLTITVVMGGSAPHLNAIKYRANGMPWPTEVLVDVRHIAKLMAEADFAIGAAGSTSWERCCLAVPSIIVALADNQVPIALRLAEAGAVWHINNITDNARLEEAIREMIDKSECLYELSQCAAEITDGLGVEKVSNRLLWWH